MSPEPPAPGAQPGEHEGLLRWLQQRLAGHRPVEIAPYRGFGTPHSVELRGRVLLRPELPPADADASAWTNLLATYERLESDELAGVLVRGELAGQRAEAISDGDGYFELCFAPAAPLPVGWHAVHLTADQADAEPAVGRVLVPPDGAPGVISDIDDTVVDTGATSPLKLARVILLGNARTRVVFPGVAAFYRALQAGPDGRRGAPVFYLSGSPWNLYDLLADVFALQGLPDGPLLLRKLAAETLAPALRGRSGLQDHKRAQIARLLSTYPGRRFILIGDSGQLDPEIYLQAVRDDPTRFTAVYIRDVTARERDEQVRAIAEELAAAGVPLTYAARTADMAADSAARGLIGAADLAAVRETAVSEADEGAPAGGE